MTETITDKNPDETLNVVLVLDRSASMRCIRQSTISAVNSILDKQRKEAGSDTTLISLYLFADTVERVWGDVPADHVPDLSRENYAPNGNTRLLDAIATAITETTQRLKPGKPESPSKTDLEPDEVLIVITTDGIENRSRGYDFTAVRELIRQKTVVNWEFNWHGPNERSRKYALGLGILPENFNFFEVTEEGILKTCDKISSDIRRKKKNKSTSGRKDDPATIPETLKNTQRPTQ